MLTPAFSFQAPASSGYGSPAADPITDYGAPEHDDGDIDLHNKESQIITSKLIKKSLLLNFDYVNYEQALNVLNICRIFEPEKGEHGS